jgi:alpha-beta hydrolase superfamily lysophospholipase
MRLRHLVAPALVALAFTAAHAQAPTPARPYKPHAVTTPDGVKLNVQEWANPQGPEILFVHGFAQSYLSWSRQFSSDLAKTFRMVTYDARGHGFSD